MDRIHIIQLGSLSAVWLAGWLLSVGFLHLDFMQSLFGLLLWPFYVGSHLAT